MPAIPVLTEMAGIFYCILNILRTLRIQPQYRDMLLRSLPYTTDLPHHLLPASTDFSYNLQKKG